MAPFFNPDSAEVSEVVLPDGTTASEVIAPDGSRVFGNVIPDSALSQVIHRWPIKEGSGTTAKNTVGSDGTINGATWNSGTWTGGYALNGDGEDDWIDVGDLGNFGGNMDTDFAIALTIDNYDNGSWIFSRNEGAQLISLDTDNTSHWRWRIRDKDSNEIRVESQSSTSSSKQRIVLNKTSNSASGMEIWLDGSQASTNILQDNAFSNPEDFSGPVALLARYSGGAGSYYTGNIDNVIICSTSQSSSEIQSDYNQQPWS